MKENVIFAIDPGPVKSAWVAYLPTQKRIFDRAHQRNEEIVNLLGELHPIETILVIEMVACFGMAVGKSIFDTCFWVGRFWQSVEMERHLMYRREVKHHLCNSAKAKDKNVRRALIDKFPATGGGKVPQIGTKKLPGPLYGVSGDVWAALAVAVTFAETKMKGRANGEKQATQGR